MRLATCLASGAEAVTAALLHDDAELQEDAIADSHATRGTIVSVEDRAPAGSRAVTPVWTVESPSAHPTRLRRGSGVSRQRAKPHRRSPLTSHGPTASVASRSRSPVGRRPPNPTKHPAFPNVPAAADPHSVCGSFCSRRPWVASESSRAAASGITTARAAWLTHGAGSPNAESADAAATC